MSGIPYNVFISWSGNASHSAAEVLKRWLPKIIHDVEIFISSEDIEKGQAWDHVLDKALNEISIAIVCITPTNLASQWINFEAGSIAKGLGKVCPFLIGVANNEFHSPLKRFQSTNWMSENDIFLLCKSIRNSLNKTKPNDELLRSIIKANYEELHHELSRIVDDIKEDLSHRIAEDYERNSLFLSTPMSAFGSQQTYTNFREVSLNVIKVLIESNKFINISSAIERMPSDDYWDDLEASAAYALKRIQACEFVLCLYPEKIASSILVEIGYAIALSRKCIVLTNTRNDLPYILREADKKVNMFKVYQTDNMNSYSECIRKRINGMFDFDKF